MTLSNTLRSVVGRCDRWWSRARGNGGQLPSRRPDDIELRIFNRLGEYQQYREQTSALRAERDRITERSVSSTDKFYVAGYCEPCDKPVDFLVDYLGASAADAQQRRPNWRERLVCPCGLNSRVRAALHVLRQHCRPAPADQFYLTEQVTPLYGWMSSRYPNVIGSEYLGNQVPFGAKRQDGVRNESLTRLTFDDNAFDYILSFDVLEHIPEYEQALRELARVLKPGGICLFSVPFVATNAETLVRAVVNQQGTIEHLHPPEYHGDPLADDGCLCYYHFGWDMLDTCRRSGFTTASVVSLWSRDFGYLGPEQLIFLAQK